MRKPLITGKTKLLGIVGYPVTHSLSPVMQNAAIAQLGVDYIYVPFAVPPEALQTAIAGFQAIGVAGFNLTIPHKQMILPWLQDVSDVAQAIGAVNTVWRTDAGWSGTNTDVTGFLAPLKTFDRPWHQITPVILGNGGAARAVVAGCIQLGCQKVHLVGRTPQKLTDFVESWAESPLHIEFATHTWDRLASLIPQAELLINTTPVGMHPQVNQSPVASDLMEQLPRDAIVYDLIYTPSPTLFLRYAAAGGATIIDGTEMLIYQGAAALEQWIQQPAPIEVMRQALQQQLAG